jgi:hypothetical protein
MIKIKNKYFNTYPVVFHHNGRPSLFQHPSGVALKRKVFNYFSDGTLNTFRCRKSKTNYPIPAISNEFNELSKKITIFMVTNLKEKGSAARSLDYYNIPYTIGGKDIVHYSHLEKFKTLIDFIPSVETEYMILFDSDDVFVIDGLDQVVDTFEEEMDCKMLFNAEGWNYPKGLDKEQTEFELSVAPEDSPFKFLNSGVWIANTKFLKEHLQELSNLESYSPNDQGIFKRFYKMFYPKIKIDHKCKYFQSLPWTPWFEKHYPSRLDMEVEIS